MKPEPMPCFGMRSWGIGMWKRLKNWENGSFSSNGCCGRPCAAGTVALTEMLTTAGPYCWTSCEKSGSCGMAAPGRAAGAAIAVAWACELWISSRPA